MNIRIVDELRCVSAPVAEAIETLLHHRDSRQAFELHYPGAAQSYANGSYNERYALAWEVWQKAWIAATSTPLRRAA